MTLSTTRSLCVIILSVYGFLPSPFVNSAEHLQSNNNAGSAYTIAQWLQTDNGLQAKTPYSTDNAYSKRHKRSYKFNFSLIGSLATARLLSGSTRIASRDSVRRKFQKAGDFDTALKDFYSVKPVKVTRRKTDMGTIVVKGKAGDRSLSLRSHNYVGDPRPILEIIDYNSKGKGRYIDSIRYTNE